MDYFKMNLHVGITSRPWFSIFYTNYILVIAKGFYMWVLHLRLVLYLRLPKSHMDYFRMNLHVGIASRF